MTDFDKAIHRTNIQEMRSMFFEGLDLESYNREPVTADYEERIRKGEKPLMDFIERLYPDGSKRDDVFDLVCEAIVANQEVYAELGMRVGAQTIFELLCCNSAKEWYHGGNNKKG